ncbi:unnamed protein product [Lepeophtheirus salmonis]|uniref:(salmon louse) hypothetical protein n=1 Tax=Lepeophtheirus salmonis TaxID=72036 RepID=A0A7R8CTP3_LEPSM|nr:unnamed protein product [Lepeophtheirus salmonis]CAF2928061.1 unnamed protein product [Lepeophtheirus salmonis]
MNTEEDPSYKPYPGSQWTDYYAHQSGLIKDEVERLKVEEPESTYPDSVQLPNTTTNTSPNHQDNPQQASAQHHHHRSSYYENHNYYSHYYNNNPTAASSQQQQSHQQSQQHANARPYNFHAPSFGATPDSNNLNLNLNVNVNLQYPGYQGDYGSHHHAQPASHHQAAAYYHHHHHTAAPTTAAQQHSGIHMSSGSEEYTPPHTPPEKAGYESMVSSTTGSYGSYDLPHQHPMHQTQHSAQTVMTGPPSKTLTPPSSPMLYPHHLNYYHTSHIQPPRCSHPLTSPSSSSWLDNILSPSQFQHHSPNSISPNNQQNGKKTPQFKEEIHFIMENKAHDPSSLPTGRMSQNIY